MKTKINRDDDGIVTVGEWLRSLPQSGAGGLGTPGVENAGGATPTDPAVTMNALPEKLEFVSSESGRTAVR
ncbi:MAG: hypothetical protein ABIU05_17795 [Nitrospirales bacterium]